MVLLGPAPAAIIAVAAVLAWSVKSPPPSLELGFNNIVALTTYPVAGALLFQALGDPVETGASAGTVGATVFAVYLITNLLNFLLIVGYLCLRDRRSLLERVPAALYLPVVPWEVATGALTAGTVLAYQEVGLVAVGLLAVMLVTSRYLLQAVVDAQRQRDELRAQMEELEALHHGVVRVMVETLGMRDRMTARHSAAVARFAKATAAAAGLPPREQELVHTAGLLHDVGKFTFPDHTLTSRHLTRGGLGADPLAPAARGGHRAGACTATGRWPTSSSAITSGWTARATRATSPATTSRCSPASSPSATRFDVMTSRDSYRTPIAVEDAIAELRRVSGTQLDGRLVEVFVGVVTEAGVDFSHGDDRDLERELRTRRAQIPAREPTHAAARRRVAVARRVTSAASHRLPRRHPVARALPQRRQRRGADGERHRRPRAPRRAASSAASAPVQAVAGAGGVDGVDPRRGHAHGVARVRPRAAPRPRRA